DRVQAHAKVLSLCVGTRSPYRAESRAVFEVSSCAAEASEHEPGRKRRRVRRTGGCRLGRNTVQADFRRTRAVGRIIPAGVSPSIMSSSRRTISLLILDQG